MNAVFDPEKKAALDPAREELFGEQVQPIRAENDE
jgi:hypothetical protein